jgi:putative endopeptidase
MASVRAPSHSNAEPFPPREPISPIRFDARDLDPATSPRVDLDAFVNARWRAANPVPPDRTCWDSFSILAERALQIEAEIADASARLDAPAGSIERIVGDFWVSGMQASTPDGIELLRAELARIDALETPAEIAAYLRDRHARGIGVVFNLDVEPDFADPARTIAYISQGGLGLPDRDDYFDATRRGIARRQTYATHLTALLELSGIGASDATAQADDAFAFESQLAGVSMSRKVLARDIGARFNPVDIDDADRRNPLLLWRAYFEALGIDAPARFSLAMPEFHAKVAQILTTTAPHVWRAFLRCRTLDDAAPFLDEDFARQHHRFHEEALRGQKVMKPRWKRVLGAIDAHVGEAMGPLYVAQTFHAHAKQQVLALVDRLRDALKRRLENVAWMGETTRAAALRKLAALNVKIGYPDRWRDWSGLCTSRNNLYANVLAARAFNQRWRVQQIGKPTDRTLWPMPPQTANAGYDPQRNEIVFPAAILAPPFFDAEADPALNYGGIGAVIAHEMIHGYDDQGSRFGPDGRFESWWADTDRARFDALGARMVRQFDALHTSGGDRIDGRLTLGENIADFGGIAVACDALRAALTAEDRPDPMLDGYTRMQRFFLNWAVIWRQNLTLGEAHFRLKADKHAPSSVRANAAPAALDEYAQAFGCEPGDPMQQPIEERVSIW